MLDDEQSQRQLLASRVNMLFRDRRAHAHTRLLIETEARMSREAWGKSMDASDLARAEVMSLRTIVHAQISEIIELQSADHSRQRAISDLLETDRGRREEMRELRAADHTRQQQIIQTLTGQVTALQGQVMALQGQVTALQGQQGPAGGPAQPELPEEAGPLIDQGVAAYFANAEAEQAARKATHSNSTEGVVRLTSMFEKWNLVSALAIAQQLAKSNIR
ncbi:hypothetical protein Tco_0242728 [Tanacetum coccineum]